MQRVIGTGGLSKSRLKRMHDIMARHVECGIVLGFVALVSRAGEIHVDAIGNMAIGGAPVASDAIFRIASMTKPVSAVAAMILVEECRLRLDDPVDDYLPELAKRMPVQEFFDHGMNVQPGPAADAMMKTYADLYAKGRHTVVKAGDKIPVAGLDWRIVSSAGASANTKSYTVAKPCAA